MLASELIDRQSRGVRAFHLLYQDRGPGSSGKSQENRENQKNLKSIVFELTGGFGV